ncbi:uncharacterized protein AB675_6225 [Cyphellophora attinorum]|uniref:Uncharacterized protein n=1 Tax=Cyphellophora attinorum TaxID=1664694 RepID=A0A0N1HYV8_9EURO|nr:uncharacterized protein AB675_6225 [Phialophora attinorum]KPI43774.1 hypothetical protein AB675_6225 [Phialophora attinorum]
MLTLMIFTALYTLGWLAQATVCTACELAPILSGRQGNVPGWCPQSRFRELPSTSDPFSNTPSIDSADNAARLASVAQAKDVIMWVIFVAGLLMLECCRRGWKMSQVLEAERERDMGGFRAYDPGLARSGDWKSAAVGVQQQQGSEGYEFESYRPTAGSVNAMAGYDAAGSKGGVALGPTDKRMKKNSFVGVRAVQDVRVNLKVPGLSYDTRV